MKILVIFAHPSHESFNYATMKAFTKGARKAKHKVDVIDLYEDKFNPVLKDTSPRAKLGKDVLAYQERIKKADVLCFVYPTFWYRAPAILEGFIDRVFTSHFAYKYIKKFGKHVPLGLLSDKKAVIIESYGGPKWYYRFIFHSIPYRRFKAVLKFMGIKKFWHHPDYYVPFGKEEMRKKYLREIEELAHRLR